jgi:hypothetical protein
LTGLWQVNGKSRLLGVVWVNFGVFEARQRN